MTLIKRILFEACWRPVKLYKVFDQEVFSKENYIIELRDLIKSQNVSRTVMFQALKRRSTDLVEKI